ncbi:MAG: natA 6 [Clostridia bacterium]|nr:natA 6 [Clostridia bacterium]
MVNIEIKNITKEYKGGTKGVDDISLSIGSGVFGLLGHNGAGKTTLMKLIATISKPTSGTISVKGFDTVKNGDEVRRLIGYLPQELTMYPSLTVFDFVSYMGELKGIRDKKAVCGVLESVDMLEFKNRKIGQLSGGMKRRTGIAQALIGSPEILIVDEPTAGLDPEERVRFRGILSRYAKDGKTVILSTHIVEDIYQLSEQLTVLRKGRLFFAGASGELLERVKDKIKVITLSDENGLIELQKKTIVISVTYGSAGIKARIMDEGNEFDLPPEEASLEDAYIYCMGGKARE